MTICSPRHCSVIITHLVNHGNATELKDVKCACKRLCVDSMTLYCVVTHWNSLFVHKTSWCKMCPKTYMWEMQRVDNKAPCRQYTRRYSLRVNRICLLLHQALGPTVCYGCSGFVFPSSSGSSMTTYSLKYTVFTICLGIIFAFMRCTWFSLFISAKCICKSLYWTEETNTNK